MPSVLMLRYGKVNGPSQSATILVKTEAYFKIGEKEHTTRATRLQVSKVRKGVIRIDTNELIRRSRIEIEGVQVVGDDVEWRNDATKHIQNTIIHPGTANYSHRHTKSRTNTKSLK
jgi:hypothetical protein